jgi:hypothetical protein
MSDLPSVIGSTEHCPQLSHQIQANSPIRSKHTAFNAHNNKQCPLLFPTDPKLWRIESYLDFLAERKRLLAEASNSFLDELLHGELEEEPGNGPARIDQEAPIPGGIESAEEERRLRNLNSWICSYGLPEGELSYELTDAATGRPIALLDLAWPNGLRMGLSGPVAVLIDEGQDLLRLANAQGYMYFTDIDRFKAYVEREVLATVGTEAAGSTMGG